MDDGRHQDLKRLFEQALERPGPARQAFLDEVEAGDPDLGRDLRSLLAYHEDDREFLTPGLEDAPGASAPRQIGRYRLLRELGRGGMGVVYEAEQDTPRRTVALKVVHAELVTPAGLRRFEQEAEVLGRLQHPGIAQVFDARTARGEGQAPFLAMELVHGPSISEWARDAARTSAQRLALLALVCDAVEHAHRRGVIHRDLKPGNILVDPSGQPKILDFGIARVTDGGTQGTLLTHTGQVVGTIAYMSPEQASGHGAAIDERTDVYALGAVAYEVLSGRRPHDVADLSVHQAIVRIVQEDPPPLGRVVPDLRGDVATIVQKAMAKERQRRYPSAAALARDIRRHLEHVPIEARPTSAMYQLRKFARRRRGLVAGLAIALVAVASGLIAALSSASEAADRQAETRRALYRGQIAAAQAALDRHDVRAARGALDGITEPSEQATWEYRHLQARLDPVIASEASGTGRVVGVAITPAGTALAATVDGPAIQLHDLSTGASLGACAAGDDARLVSLSADGALLALLADEGRRLELWDTHTRERRLARPLDGLQPDQLRLSDDGTVLALVDAPLVVAVDARTGTELWRRELALSRSDYQLVAADWSAAPAARLALLFQTDAGQQQVTVLGPGGALAASTGVQDVRALDLAPRGDRLALGLSSQAGSAQLFDLDEGRSMLTLPGLRGGVSSVAFSADGRRLATTTPEAVRLWRTDDGSALASFPLPSGERTALAWRGDQLLLGDDEQARLLDLRAADSLVLPGHTYVYLVAVSPDGATIASRDYHHGGVRLWDATTGELLRRWELEDIAKSLGFTDDGLLAFNGRHLMIADPVTGSVVSDQPWYPEQALDTMAGGGKVVAHSFKGESLATSPSGRLIAEGTQAVRARLVVRDRDSGEVLLDVEAHDDAVLAVAVSPDDRWVATGGQDGRLCLWDLPSGRLAAEADHVAMPYTLTFSPDGSRLASGGDTETIRLWDVPDLEIVARLNGHSSYVHSLAFSPDGSLLVSGSGDHDVRLWDSLPRGERLRRAAALGAAEQAQAGRVDALLAELADADLVAERLRADPGLGRADRQAALRLLRRRLLED